MRKLAVVFGTALAASVVGIAGATGSASAAECYNPGSPSSVLHDNHDAAPAPADGVVHTTEQQACQRGL
ncbi:hypothetical protein ACFVJS_20540 [Nocardioides sp. NPDC057772]|uniref:hypothetical protein n=1 Tax=Nocardioides sp. NPDC057772 TaxID=3346245 RepID=UPI00366C1723